MSGQRRRPAKASRAGAAPGGELVLYETADGGPGLEVRLQQDTVWLSQAQMVELFQRDQSVVSRHLRNVFAEGELDPGSNMQKMHIAGATKPTAFYNLDVIISVGYRVNSKRGTQFRMKCRGWGAGVRGRRPGAGDQGAAARVRGRDG